MQDATDLPVIVTGASGQLGRLVLKELLDIRGVPADQIIATTRTPGHLAEFAARGVQVREADFDRPDLLPVAFAGGRRMLVISTTPELDGHPRMRRQMDAIEAGVKAGVDHIIYTSAANPEPGTPCFWKAEHYETELALINSGATWTILRNWDYPDWHLAEDWSEALETGRYFTMRGEGRSNHITREDCARAAAGALLSPISANRRFDVTGPEALTAEEIMAILGDVAGKKIEVVHCSEEELRRRYEARGINPLFIPFLLGFNIGVRQGRYDGITNAVEQLSGSRPTDLRTWLEGTL